MERLLTALDLEGLQFLVVFVSAGALVEIQAHTRVLLGAFDVALFQCVFYVIDIILWHHSIA